MSQAIIRGIWGGGKGHSDDNLEKTVLEAKQNGDPVDKVYCFGTENKKILERCGYKPDMLDSKPVAAPRSKPHELPEFRMKRARSGYSTWWHKLKIIEAATQEFDHVLWQDFDVRLKKPLPSDFWEELKSGASFRSALTVQFSGKFGAWWRIPVKQRLVRSLSQPPRTRVSNTQQAQIVPAGGYVYIRGTKVTGRLMALQNQHPTWHDQSLFALYIDQLYRGWKGPQHYVNKGHEVQGYYYSGSLIRPVESETRWLCDIRFVQNSSLNTRKFWRRFK